MSSIAINEPRPAALEAKEAKAPAAFDEAAAKARVEELESNLERSSLLDDFDERPVVAAAPGEPPRPLKVEAAGLYIDIDKLTKVELCKAYSAIVGKTLPASWDKTKMTAKLSHDVKDTVAAAKTLKQMFNGIDRIDFANGGAVAFGPRRNHAQTLHDMPARYTLKRLFEARQKHLLSKFPTDEKLSALVESLCFVRYRVTRKGEERYGEESGHRYPDGPADVRCTPFRVGRVVSGPNVARFTNVSFKPESGKLVIRLAREYDIDGCDIHVVTLRLLLHGDSFKFVPLSGGNRTNAIGCRSGWKPADGVNCYLYEMDHANDIRTEATWVNPEFKAPKRKLDEAIAPKPKVVNPEEEDDEEDNTPITMLKRPRMQKLEPAAEKKAS